MADKDTLLVPLSHEFKESLHDYALQHSISMAEAARTAIASLIGYDITKERAAIAERRGRPRVYESDDARKEAQRERARSQRKLVQQLLEDYYKNQHIRDILAIEESPQYKRAVQ